MELREVFQIIKRKLWLVIIIVVVLVGIAVYYSFNQKDSYETSTIITVQTNKEKTDQYQYGGYYAIQASDLFINTMTGWIKSSIFAAEIYKNSNIEFDFAKIRDLSKNIYSQKIPPQNMLLAVTEDTPEKSKAIAENTIKLIKDKISQLSLVANSAANFEIVNSDPVTIPIKPNIPFNLVVAFIISLVISLIFVFFIEYLSPTINNPQRVKNVFKKLPISIKIKKIKGLANQESKTAEKFRFIRSNISITDTEEKETIVVAGLNEKTNGPIVAANLALSFARAGKKTILIDADFANPSIHECFAKSNKYGFSEFLFDELNIQKYLQKTDDSNLKIMSSGIKLSYASDTIERADLKKVFNEIKKEADVLIINVPNLNSSSEAFPLFSIVKKILLIIKIGKTNLAAANYINSFLDKKEVEKYIVII